MLLKLRMKEKMKHPEKGKEQVLMTYYTINLKKEGEY